MAPNSLDVEIRVSPWLTKGKWKTKAKVTLENQKPVLTIGSPSCSPARKNVGSRYFVSKSNRLSNVEPLQEIQQLNLDDIKAQKRLARKRPVKKIGVVELGVPVQPTVCEMEITPEIPQPNRSKSAPPKPEMVAEQSSATIIGAYISFEVK
jgi:hypothetical protein